MSTLLMGTAASAAIWFVIKISAVLAIAALVQAIAGRRASAAARHLVWTLALVGVLGLPVATFFLPAWPILTMPAASSAPAAPAVPAANLSAITSVDPPFVELTPADRPAFFAPEAPAFNVPATPAVSWGTVMMAIYITGALALLVYLLGQRLVVRRLARRANEVGDPEWTRLVADCAARAGVDRPVRLLRSRDVNVPAVFGTGRPAIVVPAVADLWTEERRQAVLLHELAHVARRDCLTQTLASVACAIYWFHPGVWQAARRMRIERELACDDRVIAAGTEPRAYAGHLLEIAYAAGADRAPALALTMARPHQLEGRMLAALDEARNRRLLTVRVRVAAAAASIALLVGLACAAPAVRAAERDRDVSQSIWSSARPAIDHVRATWRAYLNGRLSAADLVRMAAGALGIAQDNRPGTWEIRPTDVKGTVHLRISELNSSHGTNVPIEQLDGLTAAQLTGAGGPVQFRIRRDAGTFTFEGVMRNGVGAGTFTFAADPNFAAELAKRGLARPSATEQYQLARADIGFAFLDEAAKQGYTNLTTPDLVRAGQHGVHTTYLREMGVLGYRLGSLDPLIVLRDHGITPDYVREMADSGYKNLPADTLRNARDHGITPDYVRGMRDHGHGSLPMADLVNARDHGITPDYIRELGAAGHSKLPLDQLVRARDHGITPEYVNEVKKLGHTLALDDLVQARDHGITPDYIREMAAQGYTNLPMSSLIRARDHGVTPDYAKELKALGYDKIALDDLISLRDHGMTADRIRRANERAGTKLPLDMLKMLSGR